MNRLVLGVAALVAGLSGCASPARYVERTGDSGVIAIPANTDSFPNYNRSEAMALIQRHVGGNFEILEEREVATGKRTFNDQQVNNEQTWNMSNPLLPANKQTVQNMTTTQDVTEWRIAYRKKLPVNSGLGSGSLGNGSLGTSVSPAAGVQPRTAAGAVTPNVQNAGGIVPPVGPTPSVIQAGPIAPTGGPISNLDQQGPLSPVGGPTVTGSVSGVFGKTN
jgi:hypothetical protein